jgi:hypothetical protein
LPTGIIIGAYNNLAVTDFTGNLFFATNRQGNIQSVTENIMNVIQFSNRKKEWIKL